MSIPQLRNCVSAAPQAAEEGFAQTAPMHTGVDVPSGTAVGTSLWFMLPCGTFISAELDSHNAVDFTVSNPSGWLKCL